jgi:hypothetical protein
MMYYMYTLDVNLSDIPNTHYTIQHLWAHARFLLTLYSAFRTVL